jgi:hypothetical protein
MRPDTGGRPAVTIRWLYHSIITQNSDKRRLNQTYALGQKGDTARFPHPGHRRTDRPSPGPGHRRTLRPSVTRPGRQREPVPDVRFSRLPGQNSHTHRSVVQKSRGDQQPVAARRCSREGTRAGHARRPHTQTDQSNSITTQRAAEAPKPGTPTRPTASQPTKSRRYGPAVIRPEPVTDLRIDRHRHRHRHRTRSRDHAITRSRDHAHTAQPSPEAIAPNTAQTTAYPPPPPT